MVNVQEGIVPLDREVAARLRTSGKPILVAVNKVDTHRLEEQALEFSQLGFDKIFPVTAIHGDGIQALMDAATAFLPPEADGEAETIVSEVNEAGETVATTKKGGPLKIAIVGRPNVGKSSIINALTHSGTRYRHPPFPEPPGTL